MVNDVIFRDRGQSRHGLTSEPRCGHGRAMLKWIARIVLIFVAGSVLWVMAYRFINPPTTMTMIGAWMDRSEEHTSELQSLMRISYAVFCLKKKKKRENSR